MSNPHERLGPRPYQVEIMRKTPKYWVSNGKRIEELVSAVFNPHEPVLGQTDDIVIASDWQTALMQPWAITGLLVNDKYQPEGMSYVLPKCKMDPVGAKHDTLTAYLYLTSIAEDLRGQGYAGILTGSVLELLYRSGYGYVERDAKKGDGWADAISRHFKDAIVHQEDHDWFGIGEQTRFRIDLIQYFRSHQGSAR